MTPHGGTLCSATAALGVPPVLNFGSCVDIGRITLAATAIAGAKVLVEQDPVEAAGAMEAHVLAKRAALGI